MIPFVSEQQELLELAAGYHAFAKHYPNSAIRRYLRRVYRVEGKRTLRAALRRADSWRSAKWHGASSLRIREHTFLEAYHA